MVWPRGILSLLEIQATDWPETLTLPAPHIMGVASESHWVRDQVDELSDRATLC